MKGLKRLGRAKVTSKFQITIPAEVRHEFGLKVGQQLEFYKDEEGYVRIKRHFDEDPFEKWVGFWGRANPEWAGKSTDEIMEQLRGPYENADR